MPYTGLENKRILVVEDVEINQFLARHLMESWGCQVEVAENGKEAVDLMDRSHFDLVLMDIQMPVMDGVEATRQIRKMGCPAKSKVPIVALTANVQKSDTELYKRVGMNDCLPKPYQEPDLYSVVSKNITPGIVPPPLASHGPRYDLSMIDSISGGDATFVTKMLQLFLDTVPVMLDEMKVAADASAWLPLSKLAHKLKSTIDSMGITELKQDIRVIEQNGKNGVGLDKLPALVDNVVRVMSEVMTRVRKEHRL